MQNCLDTIFDLVNKQYPSATKPDLFISESNEVNACSVGESAIVVHSGLIFEAAHLIDQRYSEGLLK